MPAFAWISEALAGKLDGSRGSGISLGEPGVSEGLNSRQTSRNFSENFVFRFLSLNCIVIRICSVACSAKRRAVRRLGRGI